MDYEYDAILGGVEEYLDEDDYEKIREKIKKVNGFLFQEQYLFSTRFLNKLKQFGYTNKAFAELSDISTGAISNYCTGLRIPRRDELNIIAKYLMVSPDYLLGKIDFESYAEERLNNKIGLSEGALKSLFMIHHNVSEVTNLDENMEISKVNQSKLKVLSKLLENFPNCYMFLLRLEQMKKLQYIIENEEEPDELTKDKYYAAERRVLETLKSF